MNTICRLCLKALHTKYWCNIFKPENEMQESLNIPKLISILTGVNIINDKSLPHKMCQTCFKELCLLKEFQKKCKNSDKALRNLKFAKNFAKIKETQIMSNAKKQMKYDDVSGVDDVLQIETHLNDVNEQKDVLHIEIKQEKAIEIEDIIEADIIEKKLNDIPYL